MEILDYLRIARRRLALLILIPLLATAAAVGYVLLKPTEYTATGVVSTTSLVNTPWSQYTGPQGATQFIAAFAANATTPAVLKAASASTHIPVANLASGLTVAQQGASSNMTLTYVGGKQQSILPAINAVGTQTLTHMFGPQVGLAKAQMGAAQSAVDAANASLAALGAKYKFADPSRAYSSALSQLSALEQHQADLRASGNAVGAAAIDSEISATHQQLEAFTPILEKYNNLHAAQQAAVSDLSTARGDYRRAQAQLQAASSKVALSISSVSREQKLSTGLRIVLPVFGASIFVAIIVVAILELLLSARRAAREQRRSGAAGPTAQGRRSEDEDDLHPPSVARSELMSSASSR